jgi:hypothetical protein
MNIHLHTLMKINSFCYGLLPAPEYLEYLLYCHATLKYCE